LGSQDTGHQGGDKSLLEVHGAMISQPEKPLPAVRNQS
jgi:hypothetical protein